MNKNYIVKCKGKKFKVVAKDAVSAVKKVQKELEIEDDRLSPMTYKKLREMGYDENKWKNLTQEQANKIVASGKVESKGGISKEKPRSLSQLRAAQAQIEHRRPKNIVSLGEQGWVKEFSRSPEMKETLSPFISATEIFGNAKNSSSSDMTQSYVLFAIQDIAQQLIKDKGYDEESAIRVAEQFVIPDDYNNSLDDFLDNPPKNMGDFKKSLNSVADSKEEYLYNLANPGTVAKFPEDADIGEDKPMKREIIELWDMYAENLDNLKKRGSDYDEFYYQAEEFFDNMAEIFQEDGISYGHAQDTVNNWFNDFDFRELSTNYSFRESENKNSIGKSIVDEIIRQMQLMD